MTNLPTPDPPKTPLERLAALDEELRCVMMPINATTYLLKLIDVIRDLHSPKRIAEATWHDLIASPDEVRRQARRDALEEAARTVEQMPLPPIPATRDANLNEAIICALADLATNIGAEIRKLSQHAAPP